MGVLLVLGELIKLVTFVELDPRELLPFDCLELTKINLTLPSWLPNIIPYSVQMIQVIGLEQTNLPVIVGFSGAPGSTLFDNSWLTLDNL